MKRYLIVAHQTATDPHLVKRIAELKEQDAVSSFVLVVPATPVEHLAVWETRETEEVARRRGEEARAAFAAAGITLESVLIGDQHPVLAIEDELRAHEDGYYDAVVLSTLAPGVSRWLAMDATSIAERRLSIPLLHVTPDGTEEWAPAGRPPSGVSRLLDTFTEQVPEQRGSSRHLLDRGMVIILALLAIYVVSVAALALAVDYWFFVNAALALVVFGLVLAMLTFQRRQRVSR
jgi:hypothetical protein